MSRKSAEVGAEPGRRGSAARLIRRLSCVWCLAAVWQISAASAQTLIRADPITIEDADHVLRAQAAGQTAPIVPSVAPSALPGAVPSPPAAAAALAGAPAVGCAPASAQPVEIATLAAALKCDPDLIVEYVYNNIEYEPLFGSNKGALGTLLDQRGNDIDQAQLFTALLGAAGFSASQLNYQYGYIRINGVQASGWLGVKNDAFAIVQMLANGGIPLGSPFIYNDSNGTLVSLDLAHVWVQVQIGGTNYVFDPSFKQHTVSSGLANLGIILGYSQAQLLADAGGTIDSVSISNVNRAAIRNDLVTYAGNLIKYIKQNNPAWAVSDIIGGKSIQYLTGSPRRQTVLPYLSPSQPSGFPQNWGATVQNAYRTCIAITLPPVPPTPGTCQSPLSPTIVLFSDQTYGQRITVFSVPDPNVQGNFIPTLLVNGAAPASGTNTGPSTASGQFWSIYTAIAHPYTSGLASANEARSLTVRAGGSYLITAGWGQVGRGMVEKHRQLLAQALAVPNVDPASEAVLGESLAVIGYSWLAEHAAQLRIGDQLAQVTTQYHHGVGITGQSVIQASNHQGPFVDLPLNYYTIGQQTCWPSTSCPFLVPPVIQSFFSNLDVASALESAVLEQTQAPTPNMVAASTIKLIDINAGTGAKTFFADGTSAAGVTAYQTSIRPNLTGYSAQDLQNLNNAIFDPNTNAPTGKQAVIPARGNIQVGLWQGAGYTVIQQTSDTLSAAHLISGGLSGGFTGTDVPTSNLNDNTAQTVVAPPAAPDVPAVVNTQPAPSNPTVSDPVDAITGAYVYRRTDLVTGGGAFPYALPFGRVYRSSSNTSDIGMGNGWTHSYSLTASTTSDPYQALGGGSPISAAAAIAAIYVAQDLWSGSKNAQMMTVAAVVTRWLTDQLTNNAVLVSQPDTSEEFIALPQADNPNITIAYDPPLGSAAVLTRTGTTYGYTAKDGTRLNVVAADAGAAASAISSWASPNGTSVTFGYDGTGKLATVANNLGRRLTLGYSGTHVSSVTDESGRAVTFGYDVANNLARATDPLGFVSSLFYDGASRLTQIFYPSNPGSAFVTNSYDGLGRISAQANANGNSSAFYMAGARTELIDAAGDRHVTYQTARGKVIVDAWVLDNGVGNIFNDTAQQNGVVNVARNQYDGQDRLVLATAPEGGSVGYVYSHDLRHNIIQVTQTPKPGSPLSPLLTSYSYDQLYNKPTAITDPRGLVTVMNYDAVTGNLLQLVADFGNAPHFNATSTFSYNNLGQVVTATDPLGSVTRYSYDSYGNRTSITRDAGSGRLNLLTQMSYSAAGDVTWLTDPNGKVTANTYDAARRLVTTT